MHACIVCMFAIERVGFNKCVVLLWIMSSRQQCSSVDNHGWEEESWAFDLSVTNCLFSYFVLSIISWWMRIKVCDNWLARRH